jgi:hypothetical protein
MFNFIINFFNKKQTQTETETQTQTHPQNEAIFNKQYRISYNKLWIKQLENYYP